MGLDKIVGQSAAVQGDLLAGSGHYVATVPLFRGWLTHLLPLDSDKPPNGEGITASILEMRGKNGEAV